MTPSSPTDTSKNNRHLIVLGLWGVLLTLGYQFLLLMKEVPVVVTPSEGGYRDAYYNSSGYNLIDVVAPSSTGPKLKVLSYIVTRSVLSPWILRSLLNKNGAPLIREFAARYCENLYPSGFPINKPTKHQQESAQQWVESNQGILQKGFDLQQPTMEQEERQQKQRIRSVMDYHRLYLSKRATPSQVMERWLQGSKKLSHLRIFASETHVDDILAQAQASEERYATNTPFSVWDVSPSP